MRRINRSIFKFLSIVLALCFLNGCANESPPIDTASAQGERTQYSIEKLEDGYFSCKIFNKEGSQVFEHTLWKEPEVTAINEQLLCFVFQEGPMQSANWGIFYDQAKDELSEKFHWILDFTDQLVVMGESDKIVICSIFDGAYYREITSFGHPVARVSDGILSAELTADGQRVEVTYVIADSNEITKETIPINES